MCLEAKFAGIHAQHRRGHQFAALNRPRRGSPHGFLSYFLHACPEEFGTMADQLDDFGCRLARHQVNEGEQRLGAEAVPRRPAGRVLPRCRDFMHLLDNVCRSHASVACKA
jgi:hypothetical protein